MCNTCTLTRLYTARQCTLGVWKTVARYGPNRDGVFCTDRVSDEIGEDYLKGAALCWLSEDVLEQTPISSVSVADNSSSTPSTYPSNRLEGAVANSRLN